MWGSYSERIKMRGELLNQAWIRMKDVNAMWLGEMHISPLNPSPDELMEDLKNIKCMLELLDMMDK